MLTIHKEKCKLILYFIIYRAVCEIAYLIYVNREFSYYGFEYNFEFTTYSISWLSLIGPLLITPFQLAKTSDFILSLWMTIGIIPSSILYGFCSSPSITLTDYLFILLCFFITSFILRIKLNFRLHLINIRNVELCIVFLLFLINLVVLLRIMSSGVSLNFNMLRVYDFRAENAAIIAGGVFTYLIIWSYKVSNPFLISYALYSKKYFCVLLFLSIQVYLFAATAHKSVLLSIVLILFVWFFFRNQKLLSVIPKCFSVLVAICLVTYMVFNDIVLGSFFIRRLLFFPAYLNYAYFDFFSNNSVVYWSNSFLNSFFSYPYDMSVPREIGYFIGRPGMSANNGLISSGFANFSYLGSIIYVCLFSMIMKVIDRCGHNYPVWFMLSFSIIPLTSPLLSSDLLTSLLTHGLFLAVLIALILNQNLSKSRK